MNLFSSGQAILGRAGAWVLSKRWVRVLLFLGVSLVTLVALFYAEENFRGKRAWERYVTEQRARGEKFTLAELIPPPIPDDQNLALCPLLKPVLDVEFNQVEPPSLRQDKRAQRTLVWRDTNGLQRLHLLTREGAVAKGSRASHVPPRRDQELTNGWMNLTAWQSYYRADTNLARGMTGVSAAADVLSALRSLEPDLDELRGEALRRPLCRWPILYETNSPWGTLLPHLAPTKARTMLLQLRACARLAAGDTTGALADIELGVRLCESHGDEPFGISQLVRGVCLDLLVQPIKEGLARHQFSDAQLASVQSMLRRVDLLTAYHLAVRGDRAIHSDWVRIAKADPNLAELFASMTNDRTPAELALPYKLAGWFVRIAPAGWVYQNQLNLCQVYDHYSLPMADLVSRRMHPELFGRGFGDANPRSPFTLFTRLFDPLGLRLYAVPEHLATPLALRFAHFQTRLDQAVIACALERFHLANGHYPSSLGQLTPQVIDTLPHDLFLGQPLHYRVNDDGRYLLYSVGWNMTDEGGVESDRNSSTPVLPDPATGDWVWVLLK